MRQTIGLAGCILAVMFCAAPAAAQQPATMAFGPGLQITQAQAATIDSIMLAYRDESRIVLARGDALSRGVNARQALRRKYQAAIGQILTPAQKASYDAWYYAAEAAFEAKRPRGGATP